MPGSSTRRQHGHTQVLSTLVSGRCVLETSEEICSVQPVRWAGQGRGIASPTLQVEICP